MKSSHLLHYCLVAAVAGSAVSTPVLAEKYDVDTWNSGSTAAPVVQPAPSFPPGQAKTGQEGWVRMHFVVTPEGRGAEPIIIDSSGGANFEDEARKAVAGWQFEPSASGGEDSHNLVNIRLEVRGSRNSATKHFRRAHERIVQDLFHEKNEDARMKVDRLFAAGGLNTYESTMLWLMLGRVEGVENNHPGKLECYRRALGVSTRSTLRIENKLGLLEKIFQLEDGLGQYAAALQTFRTLRTASGEREVNQEQAARAAEIQALVDGDSDLAAQAVVYNPCNCEAGEPLWYYKPARRTFSFANLSGNVTRFEARCENHRVQALVETGKQWTLAPEWGRCRVFVFGDDGATFEFVEHPTDAGDKAPTTVARDDVLDPRNRGERG